MNTPIPKPSIGRIVHYKLSSADATTINSLRDRIRSESAYGYMAAQGNVATSGQIYPAMIVRTWGADETTPVEHHHSIQLQVFLDGPDTYWATSRTHRDLDHWHEGSFAWPTFDYSAAAPPVDNEHVAEGCEQFNKQTLEFAQPVDLWRGGR